MTFAQFIGTSSTGLVGAMNSAIVPLIMTIAAFAFVWGILQYFIFHGGEEEKRVEGRKFILWGIIGLAVLFTVWGFVKLMLSALGLT